MRALRLLLAGVLGAVSLVVLGAAPAFACSCAGMSTAEYVDAADVVVLGTVTDRQGPPLRPVMSSSDPATYTVEVERVFKGAVPPSVSVLSADSGASCGLEAEEGGRYVLFADRSGEELWAGLCGGTAPWSADLEADVVAAAGPGAAAPPSVAPAGTGGATDQLPRPTGAGPEEVRGGSLAVPAALVSGLALVLLGGTLWLRLLLRR